MIEVTTTATQQSQTDTTAQIVARGQATPLPPVAIPVVVPAENSNIIAQTSAAKSYNGHHQQHASIKSSASVLITYKAHSKGLPFDHENSNHAHQQRQQQQTTNHQSEEGNSNNPHSPGAGSNTNSSSSWSLSRRNGELQKLSVVLPQKLDPKLASLATPTIVCSNDQGPVPMTSQLWGSLVQLNGGSDVGRFTGLPSCTPTSADCIVTNPFFWGVTSAHPCSGNGDMHPKHIVDPNGHGDIIDTSGSVGGGGCIVGNGGHIGGHESRRSLSTSSRETTISSNESTHGHYVSDQNHQNYNHSNHDHHHYRRNQELTRLSLDQIQAAAQNQVTLLSPFLSIPLLSPEQEAWLRLTTQHPLATSAEQHQQMLNSYHHNRQQQISHQAGHTQQQHYHQNIAQQPIQYNPPSQPNHHNHHQHIAHPHNQHQYTRNAHSTAPQDLTKQQHQQQYNHYQLSRNQASNSNLSGFNAVHNGQQFARQQQLVQQTISSPQYLNSTHTNNNHRQAMNASATHEVYNQQQVNAARDSAQVKSISMVPQASSSLATNAPEKSVPVLTVTTATSDEIPLPPIAHRIQVQQPKTVPPLPVASTITSNTPVAQPLSNPDASIKPADDKLTITPHDGDITACQHDLAIMESNSALNSSICDAGKAPQIEIHSNSVSNESSCSQSSTGACSVSSNSSRNSGSSNSSCGSSPLEEQPSKNKSEYKRSLTKSKSNRAQPSDSINHATKPKKRKKQKVASGIENKEVSQIDTTGLITINGLPPQPSKKKSKGGRKKKLITHEEFVQRKNRSKERNRVAAKRCRQKRKQLLDELHDQKEELIKINVTLEEENAVLKRELATLISHHSICDIRVTD